MKHHRNIKAAPKSAREIVRDRLMRLARIEAKGGRIKDTAMLQAFIMASLKAEGAAGV